MGGKRRWRWRWGDGGGRRRGPGGAGGGAGPLVRRGAEGLDLPCLGERARVRLLGGSLFWLRFVCLLVGLSFPFFYCSCPPLVLTSTGTLVLTKKTVSITAVNAQCTRYHSQFGYTSFSYPPPRPPSLGWPLLQAQDVLGLPVTLLLTPTLDVSGLVRLYLSWTCCDTCSWRSWTNIDCSRSPLVNSSLPSNLALPPIPCLYTSFSSLSTLCP